LNLAEPKDEGMVNLTMGGRREGWRTLDESWLDIENIQDG
jgi:hypothetical protein